MDRQADGRKNGQTDRRTGRHRDRQIIDNVIVMEEIFSEIKLGNPGGHLNLIEFHKLTNQNNQFVRQNS
jgi:hypothetical protein